MVEEDLQIAKGLINMLSSEDHNSIALGTEIYHTLDQNSKEYIASQLLDTYKWSLSGALEGKYFINRWEFRGNVATTYNLTL